MNENKQYEPIKIPKRTDLIKNKDDTTTEKTETDSFFSEDSCFAEICVESIINDNKNETVPVPQAIEYIQDEKHKLYVQLKQIARENQSMRIDHPKIFYKQAVLMEDYEDDYEEIAPFSAYYANYQIMNYEQFRTYFTWRTDVRRGEVKEISVAYAYVYIYELLNNIGVGVNNPQDGLDKLFKFWREFRVFNQSLDDYVLKWIKSYHVYYAFALSKSFPDFAHENDIYGFYPNIFTFDDDGDNIVEAFFKLSKYDVRDSVFWSEETKPLFTDCLSFIIEKLKLKFADLNVDFNEFIYQSDNTESVWFPFQDTMFYPQISQPDTQVRISDNEIYTCRNNIWSRYSHVVTDTSKRIIGYIMKKTESELRKAVKFKRRLSAEPGAYISEKAALIIKDVISDSVTEFFINKNKKVITVDKSILEKVRQEAQGTQEKLTVENENDIKDEIVFDEKQTAEEQKAEQIAYTYNDNSENDIWIEFKNSLTETEFKALIVILNNDDIKSFADENGIMTEVLIDGINQKACDTVFDNVLEFEDSVEIYDEYKEKLVEITEK